MNRTRIGAATLVLTAATLLAPTLASADPVIDVPAGDSFEIGQSAQIGGSECVIPGAEQTYGGVFVRISGDPTWYHGVEAASVDGVFGWTGTSNDMPEGDLEFTFYCSSAPVQTLADPAIAWSSTPYERTFATAQLRSLRLATISAPTSDSAFVADPDGLPIIDRLGIPGAQAAKIKAQVDRAAPLVARIQRIYNVFLGRNATTQELARWTPKANRGFSDSALGAHLAGSPEFKKAYAKMTQSAFVDLLARRTTGRAASARVRVAGVAKLNARGAGVAQLALGYANSRAYVERSANTNYVIAAHVVLGKGVPSPAAAEASVERLDAGLTRVQVVEDLALTVHDAGWWIAKG